MDEMIPWIQYTVNGVTEIFCIFLFLDQTVKDCVQRKRIMAFFASIFQR